MEKYTTNILQHQYFVKESLSNEKSEPRWEWNIVKIYDKEKIRTWCGLGGSITGASAYNFQKLSKDNQKKFIEYYYGQSGLNYNLARLSIGSNDFCPYSYEYCSDGNLKHFKIKEDKKLLFPLLKKINRKANITYLASPWSPPSWMKDNNSLIGGKLKKECYDSYAEYLIKFLENYKKENISISYLTIQNEPYAWQKWESCVYSLKEQKDFIKNYLLAKLNKSKLDTKILLWDHNKDNVYENTKYLRIKDDRIAGVAFHNYAGSHFQNLALISQKYPNDLLWHTEGCRGFEPYNEEKWLLDAELYMLDLIGNINHGINGYIDWNILLDDKGGPNHVENYCKSPIMLDENNNLILTPIYYYLKHLGFFVKKGYQSLIVDTYRPDLFCCAFKNHNEYVIICLNMNAYDMEVDLILKGKRTHDVLSSHSIVTYVETIEE